MKDGSGGREQWITVGLIALAIMMLSYVPLSAGTANYTYDAVNRLTLLQSASFNAASYEYDQVGNITGVEGGGGDPDIRADRISHDFGAAEERLLKLSIIMII